MILRERKKQALFIITVNNIEPEENEIFFPLNKNLKHTKTHRSSELLIYQGYQGYPLYQKLCTINVVQCYWGIRENLANANTKEFIITYGKPYKPVSSDTILRCISDELVTSGINTNVYKPHSYWSASKGKTREWG